MNKNILCRSFTPVRSTADGFTPFGREGKRFVADRPLSSASSVTKEISFLWIQFSFNRLIFNSFEIFRCAKVAPLKFAISILYHVIIIISIGYKI